MNLLVSANHDMVERFRPPLAERGDLECLLTFTELLARAPGLGPGLAVIDAAAAGFDGDAGIKKLKQRNAALKPLLVGPRLTPQKELAALAAGALGCCSPELEAEQLRRILAVVSEGGVWISNAALPHLLQRLRTRAQPAEPAAATPIAVDLAVLTQREREIARMVASGDSNKMIARKLNITDRTVKAHLTTVFQKLQVQDRLQLALYVSKAVR